MEPNPALDIQPEPPAPHQQEAPTLQPTREIPLRIQHPKYSVLHYGEVAGPGDRRRNKPNKFRVQSFHQFTGQALPVPDDVLRTWAEYEGEWAANDVPPLIFDYGCLRLQVWKQSIPDPATHFDEVSKRMPFLATLPGLQIWFLRNVRGTQEVNHLEAGGSGRCQLCGSNLLGIPLSNHHHSNCIFRHLDRHTLMQFMSINHLAFCPYCGSRSATHTIAECMQRESACRQCGAVDHMECQKLCESVGVDPMTAEEQKTRVTQYRREYYEHCRRLAERGELRYRIISDATHPYYSRRIIEESLHPAGWGLFLDYQREYPQIPRIRYQTTQLYSGLVTPESDAAWSNEYPVFQPSEMDEIERLQWRVDEIRFGRQTRFNRTNPHPTYTINEFIGQRSRIREERLQAQRALNEPILPVIVDDWSVEMNEEQRQEEVAQQHPPLEEQIPDDISQEDDIEAHSEESNASSSADSNVSTSDNSNESIEDSNREDDSEPVESSMSSSDSRDNEEPAVPPAVEEPVAVLPAAFPPEVREPVEAPAVVEPQVEARPVVEPSAEAQPVVPQADIFHTEDSQWDIVREAEQERQLALTAARISSYRDRTLEVLSAADDLDLLAANSIPLDPQNLRDRIAWQVQTVTGRRIEEEMEAYPQFILRDYARMLTGVLRTVAKIRRVQRVISIHFTRCDESLYLNDHGHQLFIPTLALFARIPFDDRQARLIHNWEQLTEWLVTDGNSGCRVALQ
ncbi:hypothetical protein GCK72_026184 [Caenorhabditis remanei]|uniref:Uncharacterized protein n=1 Tax=Caenorhabditis remanei TaxID=31234 RepID=A0A6A5G458_CAERE|nr:hypothetical protein GCK72_026184 [Caenorhabditis remanei]KAF1749716.1 hypothetical protein GCK72_026184 [Caenorhabditis remanei]